MVEFVHENVKLSNNMFGKLITETRLSVGRSRGNTKNTFGAKSYATQCNDGNDSKVKFDMNKANCPLCDDQMHGLWKSDTFIKNDAGERLAIVKKMRL